MHHYLLLLGATCTALLLGYTDHRTGLMPNRITLASAALALGTQLFVGGGVGLALGLSGALLCALGPAALFFLSKGKGIGGGDVKALFALGAWMGPELGLEAALFGFLLLFVAALIRATLSGQAWGLLSRSVRVLRHPAASLAQAPTAQGSTAQSSMVQGPTECGTLHSEIAPPVTVPGATYVRFGPYLAVAVALCCLNAAVAQSLARWPL